jgi:ligand-binding sensor protein
MAAPVFKAGQGGGIGVIIVDTAADNIVAAGNFLKINQIRWIGNTAAAHSATVMEAGGSSAVWESGPTVAGSAGFTDASEFDLDAPMIINGLKVGVISSGKLYIYVGQ